MNWIDEKYREILGNRKFPESLKQQGKNDLEKLLATEMPVANKPFYKKAWFYGGLGLLLLIVIPSGMWYYNSHEGTLDTKEVVNETPTELSEPNGNEMLIPAKDGLRQSQRVQEDENLEISGELESETRRDPMPTSIRPEEASSGKPEVSKESNPEKIVNQLQHGETVPAFLNKEARNNEAQQSISEVTTAAVEEQAQREAVALAKGENASPENRLFEQQQNNNEVPTGQELFEEPVFTDTEINPVTRSVLTVPSGQQAKPDDMGTDQTPSESDRSKVSSAEGTGEQKPDVVPPKVADITPENEDPLTKDEPAAEFVGESAEEAAENSSDLELTHLAFSDFQGDGEAPDISNYKSFSAKRFAMSLWGGYTFVGKSLNSSDAGYLALRKEKEKAIWTMPTGMNLDYYLNKHWTLTIGAGWSEYGEELNYDYRFTDSINGLDGRYDSPFKYGEIVSIDSTRIVTGMFQGHWNYDFTYVQEDTAIKNNNGLTSWRYVEIPILLGYRFGKGRLKPWVQTGISFGIPASTDVRYISEDGNTLLDDETTGVETASLQYTWMFQAGVDYYLTRHVSLRAKFLGSYQLNPSFTYSGLEQRYYRLGGTIGVAYNF